MLSSVDVEELSDEGVFPDHTAIQKIAGPQRCIEELTAQLKETGVQLEIEYCDFTVQG